MAKILVGTYRSRRDADDARQRLLEQGFDDAQISVEGPGADEASASGATAGAGWLDAPSSGGRGLAGVIARMFSGFLPDEAEHERYERSLRTGSALVAVHGLDERDAARARAILERNGSVDEHTHDSMRGVAGSETAIERSSGFGPRTSPEAEADAWSPRQPDITPLPNAPTGWNEAREGERPTIGRTPNDPARPEGLTRGANDIGATEDRERIERSSR